MLKKFGKKYHQSTFKRSLVSIKNKPLLLLYIVLLDAAFLAIFYLLNVLLNQIFPEDPLLLGKLQGNMLFVIGLFLLTILYFVITILLYSFFNLLILGNIRKMSNTYNHDLALYRRMFLLNMLLFVMFFIIFTIFNMVLTAITNQSVWIATVVFLIMALILIFAYAFYNFCHSTFIMGHELKSILTNSWRHVLTKSYLGVIMFDLAVLLVYFLVYVILGVTMQDRIITNYNTYLNTSSVITLVVVYILYTFNRIYFFFIAEKKVGYKILHK